MSVLDLSLPDAGAETCTPSREACNGIDDDCDGRIDEDLPTDRECATGLAGICSIGTRQCRTGVEVCVPYDEPGAEACNRLDDDCDGSTDEETGGAECEAGGVGRCRAGTVTCVEGVPDCERLRGPTDEICNGVDDDCDGRADESAADAGRACDPGGEAGACATGSTECRNGALTCIGGPPGAETCNGVDDDCDGELDEGLPPGEGCDSGGLGTCGPGAWGCVDGRMTCVPNSSSAAETCNQLDDDCDGALDEGVGGEPCNTGRPGPCGPGVLTCADGVLTCVSRVEPGAETCDGSDEDCDGQIDEGDPGAGDACDPGGGAGGLCRTGRTGCAGGVIECIAGEAGVEVCNGDDDDCDGDVDEALPLRACATGRPGICAEGTWACEAGEQLCVGRRGPRPEACDDLDNDCDGATDEGTGGAECDTGLEGVCAAGLRRCDDGAVRCEQIAVARAEACDGLDNDCDGSTDEGDPGHGVACNPWGVGGPCATGATACVAGVLICRPGLPGAESCNGLDDDCDDAVDEGLAVGGECDTGLDGLCRNGTLLCAGGVRLCAGIRSPGDEVCNGLDDDCDGVVDEDADDGGVCVTGLPGRCAAGRLVCRAGAPVCEQTAVAAAEACNGLDDDCDGSSDEGGPGEGVGCDVDGGVMGRCVAGATICLDGVVVCRPGEPGVEVCDGADDDCDAAIDEDVAVRACETGRLGICAAGTTACIAGSTVCMPDRAALPERCNGVDDDCDGLIDEADPGAGVCDTGEDGACAAGNTRCVGGVLMCVRSSAPGAERCNQLDDDCDGVADEGDPGGGRACDLGEGPLGECQAGITACDGRALVCNPTGQGQEACNGLDDDCDGRTDEQVAEGGDCDTGLPGICGRGTTACAHGAIVCEQLAAAGAEACNGLDDDCDGVVDEADPSGGADCHTGRPGVCGSGVQVCREGHFICAARQADGEEACDGEDDDCDGHIDEGDPGGGVDCDTGADGVCAAGHTACRAGALACAQSNAASMELCNGLDQDCDGHVDEHTGGDACRTGEQGRCAAGTQDCRDGLLRCDRDLAPADETCDGVDEDCDGSTDEGDPGGGAACETNASGRCASGATVCRDGGLRCDALVVPGEETCDGLDEDCDGVVDEGGPGAGVACESGVPGVCGAGQTDCRDGELVCSPSVVPGPERCNQLDDDCDGLLDEGPVTATPGALRFVGVESCHPPELRMVRINGLCRGWVATAQEPWLIARFVGPAADGVLQVEIDPSSLSAGEVPHRGHVEVRDPASDAAPVELAVEFDYRPRLRGEAVTAFEYDEAGNITARIDADGRRVEYHYDAHSRVTAVTGPDGQTRYTYDGNANMLTATNDHASQRFEYDAFGRVIRASNVGEDVQSVVDYGYDSAGNLEWMSYPGGRLVRYAYGPDDRLERVEDFDPGEDEHARVTAYTWDEAGRPASRTLPNGVVSRYGYRRDGWLDSISHARADGTLVARISYEADPSGLKTLERVETADGGRAETRWSYDDTKRLVGVEYLDGSSEVYAYDAAGNRTSMVRTAADGSAEVTAYCYGDDNRLLMAGASVFSHDRAGRIIGRTDEASERHLRYDSNDRLTHHTGTEHDIEYRYDGNGVRVAEIIDGAQTVFVHHSTVGAAQLIQSVDGQARTDYVLGLTRLARHAPASITYPLEDAFGSARWLVDDAGALVAAANYSPFGEPRAGAEELGRFGFAGEEWSEGTGLLYLRARYYAPGTGAFTTRDPVMAVTHYDDWVSPYVFANSNPIAYGDTTGEVAVPLLYYAGVYALPLVPFIVRSRYLPLAYNVATRMGTVAANWATTHGRAVAQGISTVVSRGYQAASNAANWAVDRYSVAYTTNRWVPRAQDFLQGVFDSYFDGPPPSTPNSWSHFGGQQVTSLPSYVDTTVAAMSSVASSALYALGAHGTTGSGTLLYDHMASQTSGSYSTGYVGLDADPTSRNYKDFVGCFGISGCRSLLVDEYSNRGGVYLDTSARLLLDADLVEGVVLDPVSNELILVTAEGPHALPGVDPCLFEVLAASIQHHPESAPGVTIGNVPSPVPGMQGVGYFGGIENSEVGWIAFEADRLLKSLGLGADNCEDDPDLIDRVRAHAPRFRSMLDRYLETAANDVDDSSSTRMWFVPGLMEAGVSVDGYTLRFLRDEMRVLTETAAFGDALGEQQCLNEVECDPGLACVDGFCVAPEAAAFTRQLTEDYDLIAGALPVWGELRRVARVLSILKWLDGQGIVPDLGWMSTQLACHRPTPRATCTMTARGEVDDGVSTHTVQLTGGVDLSSDLVTAGDEPSATQLEAAALGARPSADALAWPVQVDGERLVATALSLTRQPMDGSRREHAVDLSVAVPGDVPLELTRYYDSFDARAGDVGPGWSIFRFELRFRRPPVAFILDGEPIQAYEEIVLVDRAHGREVGLTLAARGDDGERIYLLDGSLQYYLIEEEGEADRHYRLILPSGDIAYFFSDGQLAMVQGVVPTSAVDEQPSAVWFEWNDDNRPSALVHASGERIELTYGEAGQVQRAHTLRGGREVRYGYDGPLLVEVSASHGSRVTYDYDEAGLLTSTHVGGRRRASRTVDTRGRVREIELSTGARFSVEHDPAARVTRLSGIGGVDGVRAQARYDARWRPIELTDALGAIRRLEWSDEGALGPSAIIDPRPAGYRLEFGYDSEGNLTEIRGPAIEGEDAEPAVTLAWSYHGNTMRTDRLTDRRGVRTDFEYDDFGRLLRVWGDVREEDIDGDGVVDLVGHPLQTLRYEGPHLVESTAGGRSATFEHDQAGQLISIADARGRSTRFAYDGLGRLTSTSDAATARSYLYDEAGRLSGITVPEGEDERLLLSVEYDEAGDTRAVADAVGRRTQFEYGLGGFVGAVINPAGARTTYSRDTFGRVLSISRPNGSSVTFTRDAAGRIVEVRRPY